MVFSSLTCVSLILSFCLVVYSFPQQPRFQQQGPPQQQGGPFRRGQIPPNRPQSQPQFGAQEDRHPHPHPPPPGPPSPPSIDWGKCPQLSPREEEKKEKVTIIEDCLKQIPIPEDLNQQSIESHRQSIAFCALDKEGWFTSGNEGKKYKFEKAKSEIKGKKLEKEIETQILGFHDKCKQEAEGKFPPSSSSPSAELEQLPLIQLYQSCMDFFISQTCQISIQ